MAGNLMVHENPTHPLRSLLMNDLKLSSLSMTDILLQSNFLQSNCIDLAHCNDEKWRLLGYHIDQVVSVAIKLDQLLWERKTSKRLDFFANMS